MALRYEKEIRRALDSAPVLKSNKYDDIPHIHADYSRIARLSDHDLISANYDQRALEADANGLMVPSPEELRRAYLEMVKITGTPINKNFEEAVEHEKEHAMVAHGLGVYAVRYSLRFWHFEDTIPWQMCMKLEGLTATKLGFAAMVAHPKKPSEGDKRDLISMGYKKSVQEVGDRIADYNRYLLPREVLPLPLSYKKR